MKFEIKTDDGDFMKLFIDDVQIADLCSDSDSLETAEDVFRAVAEYMKIIVDRRYVDYEELYPEHFENNP